MSTLVLILSQCFTGITAYSQDNLSTDLDSELESFAKRTVIFLKQQEQTQISVGRIDGVGKASIPGGPGIAKKLQQTLKLQKEVAISDTATWTVQGDLFFGDGGDGELNGGADGTLTTRDLSLTIHFRLINTKTRATVEDKVVITKLSQLPTITGATFQTSPNADVRESRTSFVQGLAAEPFIDPKSPSRVRTTSDSPYSLELRAKPIGAESAKKGVPIASKIEQRPGIIATAMQPFAFSPIDKNQVYEVVVGNGSDREIAVSVSIDGIDVFSFTENVDPKTNKSLFTHFIVAPHSELVVPGWHKTIDSQRDDNFLAFLVTEYGKGASSKLFPQKAIDGSVGAVTVAISKSFLPTDGAKSARAETGFGPPVKQDQKAVERAIDPPHAFITIRYDR
jgi:hypothetical protein